MNYVSISFCGQMPVNFPQVDSPTDKNVNCKNTNDDEILPDVFDIINHKYGEIRFNGTKVVNDRASDCFLATPEYYELGMGAMLVTTDPIIPIYEKSQISIIEICFDKQDLIPTMIRPFGVRDLENQSVGISFVLDSYSYEVEDYQLTVPDFSYPTQSLEFSFGKTEAITNIGNQHNIDYFYIPLFAYRDLDNEGLRIMNISEARLRFEINGQRYDYTDSLSSEASDSERKYGIVLESDEYNIPTFSATDIDDVRVKFKEKEINIINEQKGSNGLYFTDDKNRGYFMWAKSSFPDGRLSVNEGFFSNHKPIICEYVAIILNVSVKDIDIPPKTNITIEFIPMYGKTAWVKTATPGIENYSERFGLETINYSGPQK